MRHIQESWIGRAGGLTLRGDAVDVWRARLDCGRAALDELEDVLSADERQRAGRFHFERDRRRYVCARGVLRRILGSYLRSDPRDVIFEYGSHGKPCLAGPFAGALAFNVSHSGELALLAFSRRGEIGVDIEEIRPIPDGEDIAARFFSAAEVTQFRSIPMVEREIAFFHCWTRKEAYVKAVGDGLARPLDGFDVTFAEGDPVRLTVAGDERETRRWALTALDPATGYAAAIVTEGPRQVSCREWIHSAMTIDHEIDHYEEAV